MWSFQDDPFDVESSDERYKLIAFQNLSKTHILSKSISSLVVFKNFLFKNLKELLKFIAYHLSLSNPATLIWDYSELFIQSFFDINQWSSFSWKFKHLVH